VGFFKSIGLRVRAEEIAQGFQILRTQHFEATIRSLEKALQVDIPARSLAGDADLILKAFQLWIFTQLLGVHQYVAAKDFQEFAGYLSMAVCGSQQQEVMAQVEELQNTREDPILQILTVSLKVATHIMGDISPVAGEVAARLMPIFVIDTETLIADTFHDKKTLQELEGQMDEVRRMAGA
jgi:hypothetical protein